MSPPRRAARIAKSSGLRAAAARLLLIACSEVEQPAGGAVSSSAAGGSAPSGSSTSTSTSSSGRGGSGGSTTGSGGGSPTADAGMGPECETDEYCDKRSPGEYCGYPVRTPCANSDRFPAPYPCFKPEPIFRKCNAGGPDTCGTTYICNRCPAVDLCSGVCDVPDCAVCCGPGATCDAVGHCVVKTCQSAADCPAHFDCTDGGDASFGKHCLRRSCSTGADCAGGYCVGGKGESFCFDTRGSCRRCGN